MSWMETTTTTTTVVTMFETWNWAKKSIEGKPTRKKKTWKFTSVKIFGVPCRKTELIYVAFFLLFKNEGKDARMRPKVTNNGNHFVCHKKIACLWWGNSFTEVKKNCMEKVREIKRGIFSSSITAEGAELLLKFILHLRRTRLKNACIEME